ncbi:MAG: glycosyltransferase [Nonlabens sp.]
MTFKKDDLIQPLLTVCIVTYNHEAYIKQCLESVLAQQTSFKYVIHVGEEDGPDGTRDIVEKYTDKYPDKIKLFKWLKKDKILVNGLSTGRYNFKETLKSARSKYVAYCDGDDYWTDPLKLQKQVDFLEAHPDFAMCFHNVDIFDQDKKEVFSNTSTREVASATDSMELAKGNYIHAASIVLRNDFTFPEWFNLVYLGDWAFYMLQVKNRKIKKFHEVMAVYRIHSSGIWAKQNRKLRIRHTVESMEIVLEHLENSPQVEHALTQTIRKLRSQLETDQKIGLIQRIKKKLKLLL